MQLGVYEEMAGGGAERHGRAVAEVRRSTRRSGVVPLAGLGPSTKGKGGRI
jgi:hypothetical protein